MAGSAVRRASVTLCSLLAMAPVGAGSPAETARAGAGAATTPFAAKTRGLLRRDGLFVTWLDRKGGRLLLELPRPSGPRSECGSFLYLEGIETGLGSNPVGLDRGQLGETRVVTFRRVGSRVPMEQPHLRSRAARHARPEP